VPAVEVAFPVGGGFVSGRHRLEELVELVAVEVRDLVKSYGRTRAVDGLTMTVTPGSIYGFVGPNGAGKTTTMKTIIGLVRPRRGSVLFAGRRLDTLSTPAIVKAGVAAVSALAMSFRYLAEACFHFMSTYVQANSYQVVSASPAPRPSACRKRG